MPRSPEFSPSEMGQEKSKESDLESLKQEVLARFEEDKFVAENIKDVQDRTRVYLSIAADESRIGIDASATFLRAKEAARLVKDKFWQQEMLREIARTQAKCRVFDEAKATAKEIRYIRERTNAYRDIAHEEEVAGLYDQAIETIKNTGERYDLTLFKKYIQKRKDKEKEDKTKRLLSIDYFEKRQEKIKIIKNDDKRDMQYFELAEAAAENGHIQKAKELAEGIIEPALRGSGLMDIAGFERARDRAAETPEERLSRVYKEILEWQRISLN